MIELERALFANYALVSGLNGKIFIQRAERTWNLEFFRSKFTLFYYIANVYLGIAFRIIPTTKTYSVLAAMSSPEIPRSIRLRELAKQMEAIPFIRDSIFKPSKLGDILEVLYRGGGFRYEPAGLRPNIWCNLSASRSFKILPCKKSEDYNARPLPIFENFRNGNPQPILFDSSFTLFLNPLMWFIQIQELIEKMASSDRDKITKLALHYDLLFKRGKYACWHTLSAISEFPYLTEVTIVSEKVSTTSENPFPAIGPQNQPPDDVEFYTPPSTAPRNCCI